MKSSHDEQKRNTTQGCQVGRFITNWVIFTSSKSPIKYHWRPVTNWAKYIYKVILQISAIPNFQKKLIFHEKQGLFQFYYLILNNFSKRTRSYKMYIYRHNMVCAIQCIARGANL